MDADTANQLLARSLARLKEEFGEHPEAEQRNVGSLWLAYKNSTRTLADLEAIHPGMEPPPIDVGGEELGGFMRSATSTSNFTPLTPMPAAALAVEAVHRARAVAVFRVYAARLLAAADAADTAGERRRLAQRAAWANTHADAAETQLQRIPDVWATRLHQLEVELDERDNATRARVTRLPVHLRV